MESFRPGHPKWWPWVEAYGMPDWSRLARPRFPYLLGGPRHGERLPLRIAHDRPMFLAESPRLHGTPHYYAKVTLQPCWDAQPFDVFVSEALANHAGPDLLAMLREILPV